MLILKYLIALLLLSIIGMVALVYLQPEAMLNAMQDALRWRAGLVRKEVVVNGIRTVYLEGGRGEPLVLLHGFGGQKDSFSRVAKYLTPAYRLIIPDVPGFGESEKSPTLDYSMDGIVERTHAFIQQLGLQNVSLAGNSMGGFIVAAYAAKYPSEVKSLWLLAAGGVASAPPSELATFLKTQHRDLSASNEEEFKLLLKYVASKPPPLPTPFIRVLAARAAANHSLQQIILKQILASPTLEARAQGLTTPTLIVWGGSDRVINIAAAEILHRMLPNSTVKIMPGIGHLPMAEDARQAADDYLAFRNGF